MDQVVLTKDINKDKLFSEISLIYCVLVYASIYEFTSLKYDCVHSALLLNVFLNTITRRSDL